MKRVLGYSDVWSVVPGTKIHFKVSTYGPERYRADLVRVISGEDELERGVFREEEIDAPFNGEHPGRFQPIAAGSHAVVPTAAVLDALESFTVQCWVFATTPKKGEQWYYLAFNFGASSHTASGPAAERSYVRRL